MAKMAPLFLIVAAIVATIADCEHLWHSYKFGSGHANRETFQVVKVTSDDGFKFGKGVVKWKALEMTRGKTVAVGLMEKGFAIVSFASCGGGGGCAKSQRVVETESSPTDICLFAHWDPETRASTAIVMAAASRINFYKIGENGTAEKIWQWNLGKRVNHAEVFEIEGRRKALIAGESTVDLYDFVLGPAKDFWLTQIISASTPIKASSAIAFGQHNFLLLPRTNALEVFKYKNGRFLSHKNVSSDGVDFVTAFKLGSQAFFAINGWESGIYRFARAGLIKEVVGDFHVDVVDFWHTVKARGYRSDAVVLAQSKLPHGTHESTHVAVLTYDGQHFSAHEEVPCRFFGDEVNGLDLCVSDGEREQGIAGLVDLHLDDQPHILVPRRGLPSGLFHIETAHKDADDPLDGEIEKLRGIKLRLEQMLKQRLDERNEIANKMANVVKLDDSNTINAPWKVNTLAATAIRRSQPITWARSEESNAEDALDFADVKATIEALQKDLAELKSSAEEIESGRGDAIKIVKVDGDVEIEGRGFAGAITLETLNGEEWEGLLRKTVRLDDLRPIASPKTFDRIAVENLVVKSVNGINAERLVFADEPSVVVKGDLVFAGVANVTRDLKTAKVNDVVFEEEVVTPGSFVQEKLEFDSVIVSGVLDAKTLNNADIDAKAFQGAEDVDSLELDELHIPGDVIAAMVNGEDFDKLADSLCLTNVKTYIPGSVEIESVVVESASANYLNGLRFPGDYFVNSPRGFANVTGEKVFGVKVFAEAAVVSEKINAIDPDTIITLRKAQSLPGTTVFTDLEIVEDLELDGSVTGDHVDDFLPNPTLLDASVIKSNFNFQHLEVEGALIIAGDFNGTDFHATLNDVLYNDDDGQTINAVKEFPAGLTVRGGLAVASETINNVAVDAFLTKNTEQALAPGQIAGFVNVEDLFLGGLFGGVNVTELDQTTVKIDGQQFVSSALAFEGGVDAGADVDVVETLNGQPPGDYYYAEGDREFLQSVHLEEAHAEKATVEGYVAGSFADFDVEDYERRRVSKSADQEVAADYVFGEVFAERAEIGAINGFAAQAINGEEKIFEMLQAGRLGIKDLQVNGALMLKAFNGQNLDAAIGSIMRRDVANNFTKEVTIKGNVQLEALDLNQINNVAFGDFLASAVYKNETDVRFTDYKYYEGGFHVINYADVDVLNGVRLENVFRKSLGQTLRGPLTVKGDLAINGEAAIGGDLNGVSLPALLETYEAIEGGHRINGDVIFGGLGRVQELRAGAVNGVNLSALLGDLVYRNESASIAARTFFKDAARALGNLAVDNEINGVDLSEFHADAVLSVEDVAVDSPVVFLKPVAIKGALSVGGEINARLLMGVDLGAWVERGVFVNRGRIAGALTFAEATINGDVLVGSVNAIAIDALIPLSSGQYIGEALEIGLLKAYGDVKVAGAVNGLAILQAEYENTLMNGPDQQINASVLFQGNALIRDNLQSRGKVDGFDLAKAVWINADQNLTAAYAFESPINLASGMQIGGLVNGLNLTRLRGAGVKKVNPAPQDVFGEWNVRGEATFEGDVQGAGLLSGVDLQRMAAYVDKKKDFLYSIERQIIVDYEGACRDVDDVLAAAKRQVYVFKHFEGAGEMAFKKEIGLVHHFKAAQGDYLLVNLEGSCDSHLLKWKGAGFVPVSSYETGVLEQIVDVVDGGALYLAIRSSGRGCSASNASVWSFFEDHLTPLQSLEDALTLQESLIPATFYALQKAKVVEYRISSAFETNVEKIRAWHVEDGNLRFVPRGLGTGLALHNGRKIFKLLRDQNPDHVVGGALDTQSTIVGAVSEEEQHVFYPGLSGSDLLVMRVGDEKRRRDLVAVASHEETSVKRKLDLIRIYEDALAGRLFHNIPTYKPSSLLAMEFAESAETILLFLEDAKTLQVYEYRGVEGFKHKYSAKLQASRLFAMKLSFGEGRRQLFGAINGNKLALYEAAMTGSRPEEDAPLCEL